MHPDIQEMPHYQAYMNKVKPLIAALLEKEHLHMKEAEEDHWTHPYEGERFNYIVKLREKISMDDQIELSLKLADMLNYSMPLNVSVWFRGYE